MTKSKTLTFPKRVSLGSVYIAPVVMPESFELLEQPLGLITRPENQPISWQWVDEARGDISVEPDTKIKLKPGSAQVANLAYLSDLEANAIHTLDLSRTGISDPDLLPIKHLEGLAVLELAYTAISNQGIEIISSLPNLHTLGLTNTAITNSGLESLRKITGLKELWLNGTLVDDEGLEHLKDLVQLKLLGLASTKVTDQAFETLAPLKSLLRLYMFNTKVTAKGVGHFREIIPRCRVKWLRPAKLRPEFMEIDELDLDLSNLMAELPESEIEEQNEKVSNMPDEQFWMLIDKLDWDHEGDDLRVIEPCINALAKMENKDIFAFDEALNSKLFILDTEKYARNIGRESYRGKDQYFSKSWFLNARCCAVANGKEAFDEIISNPENMPKDLGFKALVSIAEKAYLQKNGTRYNYATRHSNKTFSNKDGWS